MHGFTLQKAGKLSCNKFLLKFKNHQCLLKIDHNISTFTVKKKKKKKSIYIVQVMLY